MTVGKHVGLQNYCFANYAFDRESAAINFWRNPLNNYTTLTIGRLQYFLHPYKPFTHGALCIRYKSDLSSMHRSIVRCIALCRARFFRELRGQHRYLEWPSPRTSHCRRIEARGCPAKAVVRRNSIREEWRVSFSPKAEL